MTKKKKTARPLSPRQRAAVEALQHHGGQATTVQIARVLQTEDFSKVTTLMNALLFAGDVQYVSGSNEGTVWKHIPNRKRVGTS